MIELRELAPQVLGVLVRRSGDFAGAEDAVQEALIAAATTWPSDGEPDDPLGWLIRVASRRLANRYRADTARRRREELAASWSVAQPCEVAPAQDDTLLLMLLCCHPVLTPAAAIPLTLRAVGGLSTREIAAAFLVPEATMAQRISRAKSKLREVDAPFRHPDEADQAHRMRSLLQVLYLVFNEGYATSAGPELDRPDVAAEGVRLTRLLLEEVPDDPEIEGLLALMLLSAARRPARLSSSGELIPLSRQDRSRWDPVLVSEGLLHATAALAQGPPGAYGLQAAIQALHAEAPSDEGTRWADIAVLYERLERLTGNPVVRLNRAVAVARVEGPRSGLALLAELDDRLPDHHRLVAVRAHLFEEMGDLDAAIVGFRTAAGRANNRREREYLLTEAARLAAAPLPPRRLPIDTRKRD